jgi:integrase
MKFLTQSDLAKLFNVSYNAITEMVSTGKLPCYKTVDDKILLSADTIIRHIKKPDMNDEKYLERLRKRLWEINPAAMQALKEYGSKFSVPVAPKRFYLNKIKNKKLGFVYYIRYLDNGKVIPSHWCAHTNDMEAAERYALENRERLLAKYYGRDIKNIKTHKELYSILKKYYAENSEYLQTDKRRGRVLSDKARVTYHNFIINQLIPYLRKERITDIEQIDTPLLSRFQNYLLADKKIKGKSVKGIKPQTINHYISYISLIFDHLIQEGQIRYNPCKSLITLKIKQEDQEITGCYEINKLKGIFNKKWKNEFSYLLCLVIYTTGMRNSEIERITASDLIFIENYLFIDIPDSKTHNGIRKVPLHDFVYKKLSSFIRKNKLSGNDLIFKNPKRKRLGSDIYEAANQELGKFTGYDNEKLVKENITFYSGRHFWKTLMNSENLGDVEEYFMGHKISSDVAKRYNHRDKQGKKKLLEKAKKVYSILDKWVFL